VTRNLAAKRPDPPTCDYTYLSQLDATGWYAELTRLFKLSVDHDLGLAELSPTITLYCKLGNPGEATETEMGHFGLPTVQLVGPNQGGYWLSGERLPAVIVNVDAPDDIIFKKLKRMLREIRKYIKPTVAKPGRYQLNSRFDEGTFKKWQNDKIVEFADLLAWNAGLTARGEEHYWEHELGERLGKYTSRTTSETKATLRKALASLPALAAQIAEEWESEQIAQQLTADYVKRNL
jgi:hypothetical protein